MYLSKEIVNQAYESIGQHFCEINGQDLRNPKQGVTQDVSALRHLLGLSFGLAREGIKRKLHVHNADSKKDIFIEGVGEFVKIFEHADYCVNFVSSFAQKSDYGVGSNFISAGVISKSNLEAQSYPAKAGKSLIHAENFLLSYHQDFESNLRTAYEIDKVVIPLCIWLCRDKEFNVSKSLFQQIVAYVNESYEAKLSNILTSFSKSDFENFLGNLSQFSETVDYPALVLAHSQLGPETESFENSDNMFETSLTDKFLSDLQISGLKYQPQNVISFLAALQTKKFLILTGLAGSGKTKIAEAFAKWLCKRNDLNEQYRIVAVGADWTSNESLLGYADAIREGFYCLPENRALELIIRAANDSSNPYFLILDEMNLSHVERYFAQFLSAMEAANGCISLHNAVNDLHAGEIRIPSSIKLPDNLFIIGTVNVDETTYMFSPKVLDRANVIEFRVSIDQMKTFLDNPAPIDIDSLTAKGAEFESSFVERSIKETTLVGVGDMEHGDIATQLKSDLIEIFKPLADVGAEFGFRTAKEIARFVAIHRELSGDDWNYVDALDAQVVQKLMPKLHGSARKLDAVLKALDKFASEKNLPLTKEKVERMQERLKRDGFTSFAEA